jgi:hypothetical protein
MPKVEDDEMTVPRMGCDGCDKLVPVSDLTDGLCADCAAVAEAEDGIEEN